MTCYRSGGCGPYEMYSCAECPARKHEYILKNTPQKQIQDSKKISVHTLPQLKPKINLLEESL